MTKKEEKQHVYYIKISHKESIQKPKKKNNKSKKEDILMSPCKLVFVFFFFKQK